MEEVSIIIPVYNRERFLQRLFKSIEAISYPALKVILVDNGSTDSSLEMCETFAAHTPVHVEVIRETRKGANCARNAGLRMCRTEWVYFFDSDDELSNDFLDLLMPLAEGHDMLCMPIVQVTGEEETVRAYQTHVTTDYHILSSVLNTPTMLFRTEWLREIGGWDEQLTIWMDWELGVRALLHKPRMVWYTGKAFHRIYIHKESITGASLSNNLGGKIGTLKTVYEQLEEEQDKKALYLRVKILEGHLRAEKTLKKMEGFEEGLSKATLDFGNLLSFYTRWGGRGAWRLANWFCQKSRY